MKVTISFAQGEREQARRAQNALEQLFKLCRIHSSQSGDRCMIDLTFRF